MKTLKEIVAERNPGCVGSDYNDGVKNCPCDYEYLHRYLTKYEIQDIYRCGFENIGSCKECWNREIEED